ncbi:LTA synthase family protein [Shewanella algae]|uniref:LTA synthase family protein n=1 Tax=Shewanella algae TaxID=38313 RepID=UPI001AAE2AD3|nr:LTA synthase family protein [Shewanella algae]MBO2580382.1 LTA synthase family protein [Shewanella algae]
MKFSHLKFTGPFRGVLTFSLLALLCLMLSRIGLGLWQYERVTAVGGWSHMLLQGLRVDVAMLCWLWGVVALGTALFGGDHWLGRCWSWIQRLWLTLGLWYLLFLELSTPSFIEEYGVRPNRLYVEYLIYPKEVLSMLWSGRKLELILSVVLSGVILWGGWKLSGYLGRNCRFPKWYWRPVLGVLIIVLSLAGARSSLGHRPLNPAMVAFADDPLVNSLVVNSGYSLAFAISQMNNEADASRIYGDMDRKEIYQIIRQESGRAPADFISDKYPSLSQNQASYRGKPKNIVIILQESMGARFVGSLGGLPLTPNLDALADEGWYFESLYATGTRSVRGIEAVTTGFTPTPARSVVKLGKSQSGFFSLAELLQAKGYSTSFIYGGESHFDNMRSFFLGNGFSTIVDQKDYRKPAFVGSWGASDEDLMRKADSEFKRLHAEGKPFFSLVFSSSNHDPFEFPDGRIELYEQPKQTRNNAAKYADYAIGEFFRLAKEADYWRDTLFLVVADHDSRVSGASLVPVPRFRIPGLLLGDGITAKRDLRVVSQIDLPPTLLSLAGIDATYPMLGRDLSKVADSWPGRALMQYDKNFAYMQGNKVTILQPEKAPATFDYDPVKEQLHTAPLAEPMARKALGLALWGSMAYQEGLYKLPPKTDQTNAEMPASGRGSVR